MSMYHTLAIYCSLSIVSTPGLQCPFSVQSPDHAPARRLMLFVYCFMLVLSLHPPPAHGECPPPWPMVSVPITPLTLAYGECPEYPSHPGPR